MQFHGMQAILCIDPIVHWNNTPIWDHSHPDISATRSQPSWRHKMAKEGKGVEGEREIFLWRLFHLFSHSVTYVLFQSVLWNQRKPFCTYRVEFEKLALVLNVKSFARSLFYLFMYLFNWRMWRLPLQLPPPRRNSWVIWRLKLHSCREYTVRLDLEVCTSTCLKHHFPILLFWKLSRSIVLFTMYCVCFCQNRQSKIWWNRATVLQRVLMSPAQSQTWLLLWGTFR